MSSGWHKANSSSPLLWKVRPWFSVYQHSQYFVAEALPSEGLLCEALLSEVCSPHTETAVIIPVDSEHNYGGVGNYFVVLETWSLLVLMSLWEHIKQFTYMLP